MSLTSKTRIPAARRGDAAEWKERQGEDGRQWRRRSSATNCRGYARCAHRQGPQPGSRVAFRRPAGHHEPGADRKTRKGERDAYGSVCARVPCRLARVTSSSSMHMPNINVTMGRCIPPICLPICVHSALRLIRDAHQLHWQALSALKRTASRLLSPSGAKQAREPSFALQHDPSLDGTSPRKSALW